MINAPVPSKKNIKFKKYQRISWLLKTGAKLKPINENNLLVANSSPTCLGILRWTVLNSY